jgi:5-methylcytosine-specific restriction endonuclease McrA
MSKSVSVSLRKRVKYRAEARYEYCLLPERVSYYSFHVEHIRSIKNGGTDQFDNLAYCCPDCNYFKGSNVATFAEDDETLVRFFDPRKDLWEDHFHLKNGVITGKTAIGTATEQIFRFNEVDRLIFRQQLIGLNLYPFS